MSTASAKRIVRLGRHKIYEKYIGASPSDDDFEYFPEVAKSRLREIFWNVHVELDEISQMITYFEDEELRDDFQKMEIEILKAIRKFNRKYTIGYLEDKED